MDYQWQNNSSAESIYEPDDILRMLDALLRDEGNWWDGFYADRSNAVPFFRNIPDESLVSWLESDQLRQGRALELGCGPGRNAIYLAKHGYAVDAIDISPVSIEWAKERAVEAGVNINFVCESIFDFAVQENGYDMVYDCGCFHHIPPHRRLNYLSFINTALKSGGLFGLACMGALPPEEMGGADISDWQVYRDRSMHGGLGYSKERLLKIFGPYLEVIELRQMKECDDNMFGEPFAWVGLFRKR